MCLTPNDDDDDDDDIDDDVGEEDDEDDDQGNDGRRKRRFNGFGRAPVARVQLFVGVYRLLPALTLRSPLTPP